MSATRENMEPCKQDAARFCFVCGDYFHKKFKGVAINDKLKEAYRAAFERNVEGLDQAWVPSRICLGCATYLYSKYRNA